MKRKWIHLTLLLALFSGLVACSKPKEQSKQSRGMTIVTSFYPIYAMTKAVSGELNDVRMIQSGAGIHSFEPSVNDVAAIYDADLFVYHSHTLEAWADDLDPNLKKSEVAVFEASKTLTLDRVTGLEDIEVTDGIDPATLYDPHTWTDPILAGEEALAIAKELSRLDPKHEAIYTENAQAFQKEAKELADEYTKKFKKTSSKTFVTQHTAFSYLAKRFGLKQLGISGISPEQEPTPRQLTEIQDFVKEYKVKTIFAEDNVNPKIAKAIAKTAGAKVKLLSPLEAAPKNNKSYLDNLRANLEALYQSLT
ncbi:TPA: zinc ABC transporter substrate-binding protein [Streptococcus equi subsp. zooepidemicus]|uniref:metal ABC transporter solute-binding protein, Zn/Mn family n=1 Tax=Streptococcus equi TaxID=1336 RepID=UPI001E4457B9|nr:zinc ABC transporter substrate-binding protein [Streptococcus equi]MCD3459595.1 zinc ABC transporter substrate-binding protein [Streptococcus equi subsp. zooepidemicus]MDI5903341.1 zinc ABC transporter substrate-binding protein [Streptococcus equi subsp. zooepidemicus]MDI5932095.1 zinc ABC transporter substrate-binding protein [Streptococcus equi subsp. zooepidemicus]MDI6031355.1 zinc ABC transporter substrate-binding protein [Streptococcus equi subsp. zooepidemicus]HEL0593655.1 zinc ABC tr